MLKFIETDPELCLLPNLEKPAPAPTQLRTFFLYKILDSLNCKQNKFCEKLYAYVLFIVKSMWLLNFFWCFYSPYWQDIDLGLPKTHHHPFNLSLTQDLWQIFFVV